MKKILSTLLLSTSFLLSFSQIKDSVSTGTQNANDVYYSFKTGIIKSEPNNNWDLAFETTGITGSIMANHAKGVLVWQTPYSAAQWANVDITNHISWAELYNSVKGWSYGAFNRHADLSNPFDLGWGIYDPGNNHTITGDSVFLIKLANGSFKKILIVTGNTNEYNIKYANVDGSNEVIKKIDISAFKTKNFNYFRFDTETTLDREPASAEWDIVFTKYIDFIPTAYAVGGVWSNKKVKCAEARDVPTSSTDYAGYTFSGISSEIGYDWKTYNQSLNKYEITDNLVYFVNTAAGAVHKIVFTGYKGGALGTYYFNKQAVTASIKNAAELGIGLYPNPTKDKISLTIPADTRLINYTITNLAGNLIFEGTGTEINVSTFSSGIYFLQLLTEQGIQHIKFIKSSQ